MTHEVTTRRIALAAFAIAHGGEFTRYEKGEFCVTSPWPVSELVVLFATSQEKRFDDHVLRLRDLKRGHS